MLRVLLALLFIAPADAGEPIRGQATVIDGDTIEIHGDRIRLFGIDAPESRQGCLDITGREYACGREAAFALADWIGRATVECVARGTGPYRRIVATCNVRGEDIGRWLVRTGRARADERYSRDYSEDEVSARAAHAGFWRGQWVPPCAWRKGAR